MPASTASIPPTLPPTEICEFLNATNLKGTDRELAVLRIKMSSILKISPDNRRVFMEAIKLVANQAGAKHGLDNEERNTIKKYLRKKLTDMDFLMCRDELQQTTRNLQNESNLFSQTNRQTNTGKPVIRHKNAWVV
jgi:hypothetical protein